MNIEKAMIQHFSLGDGCVYEDGLLHEKTLPFFSFVHAVEGEYVIDIEGEGSFRCGEGDIFIAPPFRKQRIVHRVSKNGAMKMRWIFAEPFINEAPMEQQLTLPVILPHEMKAQAISLFGEVFDAEGYISKMGRFFLLLDLLITLSKSGFTAEKDFIADKVRRMLYAEYGNPELNISYMANRLFLSRAAVYRLFAEKIGMSPMAYLTKIRMERAAYLLASTGSSIGSVGEAVGIPDQAYFSKLFKAQFRVSPREYRRMSGSYFFA